MRLILTKATRRIIFGFILGLCTLIYIGAELNVIPKPDHFAVKFLYLVAGLFSTTYLGTLLINYSQRKGFSEEGASIKSFSDEILQDNLKALANNLNAFSSDYLDTVENTQLNYITNISCVYYKKRDKSDKQEYHSALEKILEGITDGKKNVIILGEGGAGKTTLIHDLIADATSRDDLRRVPFFLSLSKWKGEPDFEQWLANNVEEEYSIKSGVVTQLIELGKIIPCLDGLDEVPQELRQELVEELRAYAMSRSIIFSCRNLDFEALPNEFKMEFETCELQPLKSNQIKDSLGALFQMDATQKLAGQEFVKTPLMLNVIATISKELDKSEEEMILEEKDESKLSLMIWQKYDEVMFNKKFAEHRDETVTFLDPVKQNKLRFWLVWLAKNIKGNISEFFIEQLQPSWLFNKGDQILYLLISRISVAIFVSISVGLFLASPTDFLGLGILLGCIMAFISFGTQRYLEKKKPEDNKPSALFSKYLFLDRALHLLLVAFILGMFTILYLGFTVPREPGDLLLGERFAFTEAVAGTFITIFFATIFGLRNQWQTIDYDIRPVERVIFDWKQFFVKGILGGLFLAAFLFLCGLIVDIFFSQSTFGIWLSVEDEALSGLNRIFLGLIGGFVFGFPVFAVIGLLNDKKLSFKQEDKLDKRRYYANFGIKRSLKHALFTGVGTLIFFGGVYGISMWLYTDSVTGLIKGLREGLGAAILAALWFGGADFLQHWALRLTIYFRGYAPFDWNRFLKYGKTLTFLRQSGANYSFYHRTLKEFYRQKSFTDPGLIKINKHYVGAASLLAIIALVVFSFFTGFNNKYYNSIFWSGINGDIYYAVQDSSNIVEVQPDVFRTLKDGHLMITASGKFKVGNFVGYVYPAGTEAGFLGIPIGNNYDIVSQLPHGALIYQTSADKGQWFSCAQNSLGSWPWSKKYSVVKVQPGDLIEFMVNDKEWHNNIGKISVELSYCESCDQQAIAQ